MLLRLVNRIGAADVEITGKQPTNIHFHGMDVSPKPPGDNVFINISPGKSFQYRVEHPRRSPAGAALVPLAPARICRPADPLRPLGHADRGWRHREPLPVARRPARAGDGAQGHQPARRHLADAHRQRPDQSADPQPAGRAADLGDRQSRRRQLLQSEARGAPFLGPRARRQLPAEARSGRIPCFCRPARARWSCVEAGKPGRYYFQTHEVDTGPTGLPSPQRG